MSTGPVDSTPLPPAEEEKPIWEGSSSQLLNLGVFVVCGLIVGGLIGAAIFLRHPLGAIGSGAVAGAAIIPAGLAIWRYLALKCRHYTITTQRVSIREGILTRKTDVIELYRVKDYVLIEPFALRVFGLGDLVLVTDDVVNPRLEIPAIPHVQPLRDEVRKHVELCRDRKRVRVTEFEGGTHLE